MTPEHLVERHNGYLQSETLEKYITSMEEPGVGKQLTEDQLRKRLWAGVLGFSINVSLARP
ncbi:hypothetical protein FPV33_15990 [Klebsiella aerogenes]|nr:hypothetical protein FPV33_15990 [Klebsiella aerogenes]TSI52810.1 hypothetical protein FPI68_19145 [Klebsiella aerogenes]TSI73375.1 hypothetical protein FPI67_13530 [Klebsiella aerogenes]TSI88994.1 hypothetical protein FPI76_19140 [Klebsiella aerogenes]TSI93139.1 hypothetical protein FPI66_19585 [Klebsiella aerogenes]